MVREYIRDINRRERSGGGSVHVVGREVLREGY